MWRRKHLTSGRTKFTKSFRQAKVSVERDDLLLDLFKIILFTFLNNKFAHWCMYDQVPNLTNINVWFQLKHYIRSDLTICVAILIKNYDCAPCCQDGSILISACILHSCLILDKVFIDNIALQVLWGPPIASLTFYLLLLLSSASGPGQIFILVVLCPKVKTNKC